MISSDLLLSILMRIIIPITSWQEKFENRPFMVKISTTSENKLTADSAGNVLQVRSISTERFVNRIGKTSKDILKELLAGLIICIDYEF